MIDDGYMRIETSDYEDLVAQLEASQSFHRIIIRKIITELSSIKFWTLIIVLTQPYLALKAGLISGDNFTSILLVTAPLVIGIREIGKLQDPIRKVTEMIKKFKGK